MLSFGCSIEQVMDGCGFSDAIANEEKGSFGCFTEQVMDGCGSSDAIANKDKRVERQQSIRSRVCWREEISDHGCSRAIKISTVDRTQSLAIKIATMDRTQSLSEKRYVEELQKFFKKVLEFLRRRWSRKSSGRIDLFSFKVSAGRLGVDRERVQALG